MIAQLAIGIVLVVGTFMVGTSSEAAEFAKKQHESAVLEQKTTIDPSHAPEPAIEPPTQSEVLNTPNSGELKVADSQPLESVPVNDIDVPHEFLPVSVKSNQDIIWNRLRAEGYTREQTAGIMGNLRQEHNFKTDDVPAGLGIAQWMGGRRSALMARGNYLDINVQLDHLIYELNTSENRAKQVIDASGLEGATIAFQNLFERCNPYYCHQAQRINYAYDILSKY